MAWAQPASPLHGLQAALVLLAAAAVMLVPLVLVLWMSWRMAWTCKGMRAETTASCWLRCQARRALGLEAAAALGRCLMLHRSLARVPVVQVLAWLGLE